MIHILYYFKKFTFQKCDILETYIPILSFNFN
jgi:hypothetical protein